MKARAITAALATLAFSVTGAGTTSASSNNSAHRPMKATTTTDYVITAESCGDGGKVLQAFGNVGTATHLGRLAFEGSDCIFFTGDIAGFATDGIGTWTAANGDQLHSSFTATFDGPPDAPVPVIFEMDFSGGTGRFADATGHMTGTGLLFATGANTGFTTLTWSGWISY